VFFPVRLTIRHMPQAPPMRPMITKTGTWPTAPAIRSTIPRPSEMAPKTGPCGRFATGADDLDAGGIGPWGAGPYGVGPGGWAGCGPGGVCAGPGPGPVHQVAPAGAIVWRS
jgi:hypothetical protein